MWVMCSGMRRSGSTLQYHIVREILPDFVDHHFIKIGEFYKIIKASNPNRIHVGKIHAPLHPECILAHDMLMFGDMVAVHIYRNPLDAMASLKEFRPVDPIMEIQAIAKEHRYWAKMPNVYMSRYDDVVSDIAGEAMNIADFLNASVSPAHASEIADSLALDRQRQRMPAKGYDSKMCMWFNHIGTGKTGKWKSILTDAEIKSVRAIAGDIIVKYENG